MDYIDSNIFLGNASDAMNIDGLRKENIKTVFNVAIDLHHQPPIQQRDISFLKIGLIDGPGNSLSTFAAAVSALSSVQKLQQNILIHCHEGVSRSPTVLAAFLASQAPKIKPWNKLIEDALESIAEKRPRVNPNRYLRELASETMTALYG